MSAADTVIPLFPVLHCDRRCDADMGHTQIGRGGDAGSNRYRYRCSGCNGTRDLTAEQVLRLADEARRRAAKKPASALNGDAAGARPLISLPDGTTVPPANAAVPAPEPALGNGPHEPAASAPNDEPSMAADLEPIPVTPVRIAATDDAAPIVPRAPVMPRAPLTSTHTYALLEVSPATFDEIAEKLREAEYDHAFGTEDGKASIDMHGIALVRAAAASATTEQSAAAPETLAPTIEHEMVALEYCWRLEHDDIYQHTGFASREAALADAIKDSGRVAGDVVYTGVQGFSPSAGSLVPSDFVGQLNDYARDNYSEPANEWPDYSGEQSDELDAAIAEAVDKWADKHGLQPTFWTVEDEQKHVVTEADVDAAQCAAPATEDQRASGIEVGPSSEQEPQPEPTWVDAPGRALRGEYLAHRERFGLFRSAIAIDKYVVGIGIHRSMDQAKAYADADRELRCEHCGWPRLGHIVHTWEEAGFRRFQFRCAVPDAPKRWVFAPPNPRHRSEAVILADGRAVLGAIVDIGRQTITVALQRGRARLARRVFGG